jgi:hypothetical protein
VFWLALRILKPGKGRKPLPLGGVMDTLLRDAIERLEGCKEFLINLALNYETDIKKVLDIPFDELPMHVNEKTDHIREMVLARLRKEDLIKDSKFVLQSLWDAEFDSDDYKNIGWNDGSLSVLGLIFKHLGDKKHADEAFEWTYSE